MITIIITSYDEPKSTINAVNQLLRQHIPDVHIVIAEPFEDNIWEFEAKFSQHKNITYYQDEGKGKSHTLNQLLKKYATNNTNDLLVFTDGDVYIGDHTLSHLLAPFKDASVGVVCGRPATLNPRDTKLGYWSHLLFFEMNRTRKKLSSEKQFFEVSGYLFAIRNGVINEFHSEASEDNVIPSIFWNKGYKIAYAEDAPVYVMNPKTYKDWVTQKKRNLKGHIALKTHAANTKRKNTIFAEAWRGFKIFFTHPRNAREYFWAMQLLLARLHVWFLAYYETKFKKQEYKDGWREELTESTRIMD